MPQPPLTLQPLRVKDYALWAAGKAAFELRLSSLPPRLARLRWAEALQALESEGSQAELVHACRDALRVLARSLQLPEAAGRCPLRFLPGPQGLCLSLPVHREHGRWAAGGPLLTPPQIEELRLRVCRLNGYALPREDLPPELAEALERSRRAALAKLPPLRFRTEDLCAALSLRTGRPMEEIAELPIRQFHALTAAADRWERRRLYRQLQALGLLRPDAPPSPGWLLEAAEDLPPGCAPLGVLDSAAGGLLMQNPS